MLLKTHMIRQIQQLLEITWKQILFKSDFMNADSLFHLEDDALAVEPIFVSFVEECQL